MSCAVFAVHHYTSNVLVQPSMVSVAIVTCYCSGLLQLSVAEFCRNILEIIRNAFADTILYILLEFCALFSTFKYRWR